MNAKINKIPEFSSTEGIHTQKTKITIDQHEAKREKLIEDEKDLEEKAFNQSIRSVIQTPKIQKKLSQLDQLLKKKNL